MTRRTAAILGWSNVAVTGVLGIGGLALNVVAAAHVALPATLQIGRFEELGGVYVVAFAVVGALIVSQRPGNVVGWLCCVVALFDSLTGGTQAYLAYDYYRPGSLPGFVPVAWLRSLVWMPPFEVELLFLPLLFPTGAPPSRRWRPVLWLGIAASTCGMLGFAIDPAAIAEYHYRNPTAGPTWLANAFEFAFVLSLILAFPVVIASLVVRFRHGSTVVRHQIKWFAAAATLAVLVVGLGLAVGATRNDLNTYRMPGFDVAWPLALAAIPISIGIAILRHQLYDVDVVINRALLYGALAAIIAATYLLLVVGIGTLIGAGGRLNLVLSVAATAIIAFAFQPLRLRLNRLANRLVYGRRAVPYEVLAEFSKRTAEAGPPEELPVRMVRVLADATGAAEAAVWLRVGHELRTAAAWPAIAGDHRHVELDGETLPDLGAQGAEPVLHHGELLGALTVTKPRGTQLEAIEQRLLADLAAQAAVVLRNLRLTAELMQRLDELRASRERLVGAQDEERRRIERNLHDGAQQQLVALKVKLGLARALAEKDGAQTRLLLDQLVTEAGESLESLRELAHGIYPPLLEASGLGAALSAQARKSALQVDVQVETSARYRPDVEAAVYFCCLEAIQNAAKYSGADSARIDIDQEGDDLVFRVSDRGRGYEPNGAKRGVGLQNMTDRVEALGGTLHVQSAPGAGTSITGRIPAEPITSTAESSTRNYRLSQAQT